MKIKTLMTAAMLSMGLTAAAQATYVDAEGTTYTFQKHLFLNVEGGAQYTLGEAKFKDLLSPNVQLGLGYQFSPVFAGRIQANAWQSKGGWNGYIVEGQAPFTKDYKYNYVAPGIDLMFNLSNLICGYNPMRVFNVTAFIGGGANVAWGNDEAQEVGQFLASKNTKHGLADYNMEYLWDGSKIRPFGRAGLELGFRLSDAVQLNVEGNANILGDKYNSKKAENPDWYFDALVGLRVNLGKTYTKKAKELPPPPPPVEPVVIEEPIVEPTPDPVVEPIRENIFFEINKWVIRSSEVGKIQNIANYLKKYPKSTVALTGYADVETGNDRINDKLSENRANVVKQSLMNDYGIAESRIKIDWKGSRVQPFPTENEKNRVTIAIAEQ